MRSSRISRDTSRVAASLAASRSRRTLHQPRLGDNSTTNIAPNTVEAGDGPKIERKYEDAGSDSELSSVPGDLCSDYEGETLAGRKRKRGQPKAPVATSVKRETEITSSHFVKREATELSIADIPSSKSVKHETKELSTTDFTSSNGTPNKPKPPPRPSKKKNTTPLNGKGTLKLEPPPNWEEIYALTRQMRNENPAPVDTMGCESLADRAASPRDQRFQTLISLMLSSQTKDTVTSAAIKDMQTNMPGGLNLESILAISPADLDTFISKIGFHNRKTVYIKSTAILLRDTFSSDIPSTIAGLTSLPGVGPKMAYLCLSAAWGRTEGIGVDVHVHRITNLWGWNDTKTPEETRKALQSWLPRERWHDINNLLVGFGQAVCLPVGRRCGECRVGERGLCPSMVVGKRGKTRVKKEAVVKSEEDGTVGFEGELEVAKEEVKVEDGLIVDEELKAEDGAAIGPIPDIEDIGKGPRGRTPRKRI